MANFNQALFRIDPTEGLLQYVQAVKPFHSKVLDVFVEYIYAEPVTITASDRYAMQIGLPVNNVDDPLRVPTFPIVYSRGFGYVWSPYSSSLPGGAPTATVIKATGPINILASPSGTNLVVTPDVSEHVFNVGDKITLTTTGTFPSATGVTITQGTTYYVVSVALPNISISTTPGGAHIFFTSAGTGQLTIVPQDLPYNSFLISSAAPTPFDVVVTDLKTNQLAVATSFSIINVLPSTKQWVVAENLQSGATTVAVGDMIYINSNADPTANGKYTVVSAVWNGVNTTIMVAEPISLVATASGKLYVANTAENVPYWPAGSALKFTTTGVLPFPLTTTTTYYLNPTSVVGTFNLATRRYPQHYSDIVDLISLGTGTLKASRVEPFMPGEVVTLSGSYLGTNDGEYVLNTISPEGGNFRVTVRQSVPQTTPTSLATDGTMSYIGGYGDPVSDVISSPDLFTSTYFHERIQFDFSGGAAAFLLDNFLGVGNLSTHTVDSGHTWSIFQLVDSLTSLVLTGSGSLVTSDPDIWVRSNWTPPVASTFYVEFDVYVKAHPGSGSPYFRVFAKEANLINFHGPHVDVYPNLATGKIAVQVWDGDAAVGNLFTTDTAIPVDSTVTVKLMVVNHNQVKLYVNGTLLYTSAVVTWPTLTFVGFNFRTPAGDPTQFELSRILATT